MSGTAPSPVPARPGASGAPSGFRPGEPGLSALLAATARGLAARQHAEDGPDFYRGEFPMQLTGPVSREDHNFLTGYALLHLACALRRGALPPETAAVVGGVLERAREVVRHYQSPGLTSNWYHGKGMGCAAPAGYPWPGGVVLVLRDDWDDTAVSALLTRLGPFEARAPYRAELFLPAAGGPGTAGLTRKSRRRIEIAGVGEGVYRSWVLPESMDAEPGDPRRVLLPPENSVELTTVANIVTAVHLLGGSPDLPSQRASRAFVDGLARFAVERLLAGDAAELDFSSSYYPRVPFAPLAFLVRGHWLSGGTLLAPATAALIARAVCEVSEDAGWRMRGFLARVFWLSCAAWSAATGLVPPAALAPRLAEVWRRVRAEAGPDGAWPDLIFFHAAHLGDYSGVPYAQALMTETMALLRELGIE